MSSHAITWALTQTLVDDHTARHVLLVLANYADPNGCNAFPAAEQLARETGLTERTVREKLEHLEQAGVIRSGDRALLGWLLMKGQRAPICYDLIMDAGAPQKVLALSPPAGAAEVTQ